MMRPRSELLLPMLALAACVATALLIAPPALAASEPRVESSTMRLTLGADGVATVQHELVLARRGAALSAFTLRGVDLDAAPLAGATLMRVAAGAEPEPLELSAGGGQLALRAPRGQRQGGGSFVARLAYRTDLANGGRLRALPDGQHVLLHWTGPRFDDGVDSVTLIVSAPPAERAPELAPGAGEQQALMSTLRRSRDGDELELVRAHVARDEAATWDVLLDRSIFAVAIAPSAPAPSAELNAATDAAPALMAAAQPSRAPRRPAPARPSAAVVAIAAGLLYALGVRLKAKLTAGACRARGSEARPWIAWSTGPRALAAGSALSAAAALAASRQPAVVAAAWLLVAMAFAAHRTPRELPALRGPGEWRPLEAAALTPLPAPPLPGAWLDAGTARGFAVFAAALGAIVYVAARVFASSPYTGGCVLLGGAALFPIFCTGRGGELPVDLLQHARRFLGEAARRLARDGALVIQPIGRVAAAGGELDELRLSIAPAFPVPGLIGIELGVEPGPAGLGARPVVVVRAAEGSECQRRLPRGLTWTRGRSADERACLVRPKLPSLAHSVALLQELSSLLLAAPAESRKAARSAGKALSTEKPGTRSSPAHAT